MNMYVEKTCSHVNTSRSLIVIVLIATLIFEEVISPKILTS